jgi:hypothetical protein
VADCRTLCQEDLDTLVDLLRIRPLQFCLFLAALFGEEQMEVIISSSVQLVKALRAKRRESLDGIRNWGRSRLQKLLKHGPL